MLGRNVRCPPTLTPRRNTTRAIRDKEIGYLLHYVLPPEPGDQNVRGGDGVLDREIDPHSGNRRHRVRGVADTEETGPVPFAQAVDLNREQLDVSPIPQLRNPISQERIHLHDITPECVDTATLDLRESAFLDHQPALPVIAA